MPNKPTMTKHCANINQLRLRPSRLVSNGSESRSTKGAHTHLKP